MLWKKLFRDLNENKGTYLACTVIVIMGLMVFTAFSMVSDNLQSAKDTFYRNQNFADGFVQARSLPYAQVDRLEKIREITEIQGRLVKDVRVLLPGREDNIYLRLISIDPQLANPINNMLLLQGIPLSDKGSGIWVDSKFFTANGLTLYDDLQVIAGGKKHSLQVTGSGQTPEYIYALRTFADFYPTPENFGIALVPLELMKNLFPQERVYNDLVFKLAPQADFEEVKAALEYELKPYGVTAIFPRADQVSDVLLEGELNQLAAMSTALPVLFLSIAAMILYIVLKRLIEQQRGQIGILKAIGYTQGEVIRHYLSYALVIGTAGGILGVVLGAWLSRPFINLYQMFFNMPGLASKFEPQYLVMGILLSLGFSLVAGFQGSKRVLALEPAEAMRPVAPVIGRKVWAEKIPLVWNMLTVQGMMAMRNISRNKGRSFIILIGVMFCYAISAFTGSMNELFQKMLFDQYEYVEVYDVKVTLNTPVREKSVDREIASYPGVRNVEALAEIPVTLKNQWRKESTVLLGIPGDGRLYNIVDDHYNKIQPPESGLYLTERLADLLQVQVGSTVQIESPYLNENAADQIRVAGVIPQYVGMNAYMELGAARHFLREGDLTTSFLLEIAPDRVAGFQEHFLESQWVAAVDEKSFRLEKMQEMMESYGSMIYIYLLIGVIIGFAIIYSSSIITVSERSRELASMMVLGMTAEEVLSVITFEQWILGGLGMAAGIPLAHMMLSGISESVSSDVFTMPVNITFGSYLLGAAVTCGSIWIAQRFAARKIGGLSLVEVLKSGE